MGVRNSIPQLGESGIHPSHLLVYGVESWKHSGWHFPALPDVSQWSQEFSVWGTSPRDILIFSASTQCRDNLRNFTGSVSGACCCRDESARCMGHTGGLHRRLSTFYWEIWKDRGKLDSSFKERKLPDSLSVRVMTWSKSGSPKAKYIFELK